MSTVHHQEYLNAVYTQWVFVMLVLLASASAVRMEHPDRASRGLGCMACFVHLVLLVWRFNTLLFRKSTATSCFACEVK